MVNPALGSIISEVFFLPAPSSTSEFPRFNVSTNDICPSSVCWCCHIISSHVVCTSHVEISSRTVLLHDTFRCTFNIRPHLDSVFSYVRLHESARPRAAGSACFTPLCRTSHGESVRIQKRERDSSAS